MAALLCAQVAPVHRIKVGPEAIELAGACRISEREFEAWDTAGNRSPQLEDFVRTWLNTGPRLPQLAGRKLRFAIFRVFNSPPYSGASQFENDNMVYLGISDNRYRLAVVISSKKAKFGTVAYMKMREAPMSGLLSTKAGSVIRYMGRQFKMLKWESSPPHSGFPAARTPSRQTWTLTLEVKPSFGPKEPPLTWRAVGRDDLYVRVIGRSGTPTFGNASIPLDAQRRWGFQGRLDEDQALAETLQTPYDRRHSSVVRLTTNVDPARIAGFKIKGSLYERFVFTQILMDPR